MTWGLVAVIMEPKKLKELMCGLYYRLLPHLGVNRCITTPCRMLPEMYQGLGLPNFLVLSLASKVSFLQCNWDFPGSTGDMLRFNYEAFLVEVGLYGNPFG